MRNRLIIFACFFIVRAHAQQNVLVYLSDKGPETQKQLLHPEIFLSEACIERRMLCNSGFDLLDIPVCADYIAQLEAMQCRYLSSSRWMNAVMVNTPASNIHHILQLPFVENVVSWVEINGTKPNTAATQSVYNYGSANAQITQLNLDKLHDQGFTGNTILIMVCDGGFRNVNTLNAFQYIRNKGRIKATRDFINNDGDVYADDTHGEEVFSVLASKVDGGVIGSGFDADFMLARTENVNSETHAEEYAWTLAAEWADSAGARIIQSSVGYSDFDSGGSYSPSQMDGKTAIITQAALIAMRKGIVVVNSAGNEGSGIFQKITAPSDADSILCVGSVYAGGARVSNSGMGPSADGRVKPDVMAMGGNTALYNINDMVVTGTGTSFAAPLIAGLSACLLQKNKYVTHIELVNAVKQSADRYNSPDSLYGYGIPNAFIADTLLKTISQGRGIMLRDPSYSEIIKNKIITTELELNIELARPASLEIFSASGALVFGTIIHSGVIPVGHLAPGIYYTRINGSYIGKFVRQ